MASLQGTVVNGTLEATSGFTNVATIDVSTSMTSPLYIGTTNAVAIKNKADAGTQGTIEIDASGNVKFGGDAGNIITSTVTPVTAGTGEFHGTGDY